MVKCSTCYEEADKNSIALCKKIFGKKTKKLLCIHCLSDYLELSEIELTEMIEDYKKQGCTLFE